MEPDLGTTEAQSREGSWGKLAPRLVLTQDLGLMGTKNSFGSVPGWAGQPGRAGGIPCQVQPHFCSPAAPWTETHNDTCVHLGGTGEGISQPGDDPVTCVYPRGCAGKRGRPAGWMLDVLPARFLSCWRCLCLQKDAVIGVYSRR